MQFEHSEAARKLHPGERSVGDELVAPYVKHLTSPESALGEANGKGPGSSVEPTGDRGVGEGQ